MTQNLSKSVLGMSGAQWCLLAGLLYGLQSVFTKEAYENGMKVTRFILIRHLVLMIASYVFGKLVRGVNFDLRAYDLSSIKSLLIMSTLKLVSKSLQYTAIAFIPLALSSTI
mmetsp:Transcript_11329/g.19084  ORF Transcript_11329/g.19084 Transcript_11329/m.19084 type:complete len:112 (-) Transcript_11329:869-1204(-)